ncbi:DUF4430 domain-containing protein [Oceanobacillus halophilus]|uniref:DUF4430 domain-containing protein n=1 Tax=Oceanobacillus halophilus TaxID=930130 RepID=A0A494ZWK3_9BACI|nr:DUF4430 domain-containing protein [Oceanobacillus halophilus]RKQ29244.1 DUF4430 domain-containing protein [Oceanobacillus halophilus]
MNKWMMRIAVILGLALFLVGCGSGENTEDAEETDTAADTEQAESAESSDAVEETVTITISENEGETTITEKEVPVEEGAVLLDVMKENFEIEEQETFITSIDGKAPAEGEEKSWMFFINDEMPTVGAGDYELNPGDEVVFDLQAWK